MIVTREDYLEHALIVKKQLEDALKNSTESELLVPIKDDDVLLERKKIREYISLFAKQEKMKTIDDIRESLLNAKFSYVICRKDCPLDNLQALMVLFV